MNELGFKSLPWDIEILGWCPVGSGASLALVDHPSSNGVTIKMSYGLCNNKNAFWGRCFIQSTSVLPSSFLIGLIKSESSFIVRSVETDLGRWTLVEAVISVVDAYPFLAFSDLTFHLEDTE